MKELPRTADIAAFMRVTTSCTTFSGTSWTIRSVTRQSSSNSTVGLINGSAKSTSSMPADSRATSSQRRGEFFIADTIALVAIRSRRTTKEKQIQGSTRIIQSVTSLGGGGGNDVAQ